MAKLSVLIDGFNLFHGIRAEYHKRFHWLDVVDLARSLRSQDQLLEVQYFTARILNDPAGAARQSDYLDALQARNGSLLKVVLGRHQQKDRTCRKCQTNWITYEEKETDVNIALALVETAVARVADSVLIISADSDLCPAVRSAKKLNPSLNVIVAFPPQRNSVELQKLADVNFRIGRGRIKGAQMPQSVLDLTTGTTLTRPPTWQ